MLRLVQIKALCRRANVEKLEAGPRGLTLAFRDRSFAIHRAVKWVGAQGDRAYVRPDMRIVFVDDFEKLADRLEGTLKVMREIAKIAGKRGKGDSPLPAGEGQVCPTIPPANDLCIRRISSTGARSRLC